MRATGLVKAGGVLAGAGAGCLAAYTALAWARYGHPRRRRDPDPLLDRFLPVPEVEETHRIRVRAPAEATYAAAKQLDIAASPIARAIFGLRTLPARLRGRPPARLETRGLLAETLELGWGVLAEDPGRQIVVGAYTQPWQQEVRFHGLPAERFAAFCEPGFVKIAWTLAVEPLGEGESVFVTRTRAVATSADARAKFRRYWAAMSAGIILLRYLSLPQVKREAERQAGQAARGRSRRARAAAASPP